MEMERAALAVGHLLPYTPTFSQLHSLCSSPSPKSFNSREVWDGFVAKARGSGIQIPNWGQGSPGC